MLSELISSITMTVTELNEYANNLLAKNEVLQGFLLSGEVSNFKKYPSGHWYFTLKDDKCAVRCVMFKQANRTVPFAVADGMHVTLGGYAAVYPRDGSFQVYAQTMRAEGVGVLYEQFEKLKKKLEAAGLFDKIRKRQLPRFPKKIAVITSSAGAVIRDIIQVAHRRNPGVEIMLIPVRVQGEGAAEEMVEAFSMLKTRDDCDLVIIGRGGGSLEDLWAFNNEKLAYAIAQCPIPVISAVGHETDSSISDFVADVYAPTPSAAAELAVPLVDVILQDLDQQANRLYLSLTQRIGRIEQKIAYFEKSMGGELLAMKLEQAQLKQQAAMRAIKQGLEAKLMMFEQRRIAATAELSALNPEHILTRGYAIVRDKEGNTVYNTDGLQPESSVMLVMRDGTAQAVIKSVMKGN
ncbi:MAG: exodeoxyribonuclease VII large subunit [Clostridia bacterium]|nr:exodeoxyribonuclease VII large subunit [Clostridia bacterium]